MHLSNTGSQFSIEKYFRAVFDKLKKNRARIFAGFGCFGGFCPERLRGMLTVTTVKRGVSQIWYAKRALVYYDVCHNKCAGETPGSRNHRNTRNPRKSEGRFIVIFRKRPKNIAVMNHRKSRNWYSRRVVAYYEVFNSICTPGVAETTETPKTAKNPR